MAHRRLSLAGLRPLMLTAALALSGCAAMPLPVGSLPDDPERAAQQYRLGLDFTQGVGVKQDYARGLGHFKQAARLGSDEAAYMAGMAYMTGRGTGRDFGAAARWLEPAAEAGHPNAAYQLGRLHINGLGIPEDEAWGAYWLGRAAAAGHGEAMLRLAICYHAGMGLPKDPGMAWYWADQAAQTGTDKAVEARSRLRAATDAAQRTQAAARARRAAASGVDLATATYMQRQLQRLGYAPGVIDGLWGPRSAAALDAFRGAKSLPQLSGPTAADLERLRSAP